MQHTMALERGALDIHCLGAETAMREMARLAGLKSSLSLSPISSSVCNAFGFVSVAIVYWLVNWQYNVCC